MIDSEMLKEIRDNLKTQDNRVTANPIFIVYDVEKISADPKYVDTFEYADPYDGYEAIGTTKDDLIKWANKYEIELPATADLEKMEHGDLFDYLAEKCDTLVRNHYVERNRFAQCFFTEASAKRYIERNKHHLSDKVHIYVDSLNDNHEMRFIRNGLLNGDFVDNHSEILKIIEAGMEGDKTKLIAYANLLVSKVHDTAFSNAIIARITGEYKNKPLLHLMSDAQDKKGKK